MKTRLLSFFILFIPFLAISQVNSSIDFMTGFSYSDRYQTLNTGQYILKNFRWRLGVNYNTRVGRSWFMRYGIRLASHESQKRTQSGFFACGAPPVPIPLSLVNEHWYIGLPVIARYEFGGKRIILFTEIGLTTAFYLTTREVLTYKFEGEDKIRRTNDLNRDKDMETFQLKGSLSVGANYNVNPKLQLSLQPTMRYHITEDKTAEARDLVDFGLELVLRKVLN